MRPSACSSRTRNSSLLSTMRIRRFCIKLQSKESFEERYRADLYENLSPRVRNISETVSGCLCVLCVSLRSLRIFASSAYLCVLCVEKRLVTRRYAENAEKLQSVQLMAKQGKLRTYLEYAPVKLVLATLGRLPAPTAYWIGQSVGKVAYRLAGDLRRTG